MADHRWARMRAAWRPARSVSAGLRQTLRSPPPATGAGTFRSSGATPALEDIFETLNLFFFIRISVKRCVEEVVGRDAANRRTLPTFGVRGWDRGPPFSLGAVRPAKLGRPDFPLDKRPYVAARR